MQKTNRRHKFTGTAAGKYDSEDYIALIKGTQNRLGTPVPQDETALDSAARYDGDDAGDNPTLKRAPSFAPGSYKSHNQHNILKPDAALPVTQPTTTSKYLREKR